MDDTELVDRNACSLSEQAVQSRRAELRRSLSDRYLGVTSEDGALAIRFEGVAETLPAVAAFVERERDCCAFATYDITVEPPYEATRLVVSGPEGTADLFREEVTAVLGDD